MKPARDGVETASPKQTAKGCTTKPTLVTHKHAPSGQHGLALTNAPKPVARDSNLEVENVLAESVVSTASELTAPFKIVTPTCVQSGVHGPITAYVLRPAAVVKRTDTEVAYTLKAIVNVLGIVMKWQFVMKTAVPNLANGAGTMTVLKHVAAVSNGGQDNANLATPEIAKATWNNFENVILTNVPFGANGDHTTRALRAAVVVSKPKQGVVSLALLV